MVKLVNTRDLGSRGRKVLRVRTPFPVPYNTMKCHTCNHEETNFPELELVVSLDEEPDQAVDVYAGRAVAGPGWTTIYACPKCGTLKIEL